MQLQQPEAPQPSANERIWHNVELAASRVPNWVFQEPKPARAQGTSSEIATIVAFQAPEDESAV